MKPGVFWGWRGWDVKDRVGVERHVGDVSENIKRWACSTLFSLYLFKFQDISAGVEWLYQQSFHTDKRSNIYLATWIHILQCLTTLFWVWNMGFQKCTKVTHAPCFQGDETVGISLMLPLYILFCWRLAGRTKLNIQSQPIVMKGLLYIIWIYINSTWHDHTCTYQWRITHQHGNPLGIDMNRPHF